MTDHVLTTADGSAGFRPSVASDLLWQAKRLFWRARRWLGLEPESPIVRFAREELRRIRSGEPDEMQDAIESDILQIVRVFARQDHSGFSAAYAIGIIQKLLRYEPITPLTGAEDEWNDVSEYGDGSPCWQNRRCSHVFKNADGAYDIDGRVFVEPNGVTFTSRDSRVPVTFPYTPKTEYVRVDEDGKPLEGVRE